MAKSAPKTEAGAKKRPAEQKAASPEISTTRADASPDELAEYFRMMLTIRRFEERAGQLYGMGLIGGFCHLYIGQEAVVVGMMAAVKTERLGRSPPIAITATCSRAAWTRTA